jgi:hypothetical protein
MSLSETKFPAWDWGIVDVYLLTTIVNGLWTNRYVGNLSDYLVAGCCLQKIMHVLANEDPTGRLTVAPRLTNAG